MTEAFYAALHSVLAPEQGLSIALTVVHRAPPTQFLGPAISTFCDLIFFCECTGIAPSIKVMLRFSFPQSGGLDAERATC